MKDIKCQIRSIVKLDRQHYRAEAAVTLEAVLSVPYQFGDFLGELLITDGYYMWSQDHFALVLDAENSKPLYGTYVFRDGVAYHLSRRHHATPHAALDHALPRLGTPMIDWIARIDALDLHPACVEVVPA